MRFLRGPPARHKPAFLEPRRRGARSGRAPSEGADRRQSSSVPSLPRGNRRSGVGTTRSRAVRAPVGRRIGHVPTPIRRARSQSGCESQRVAFPRRPPPESLLARFPDLGGDRLGIQIRRARNGIGHLTQRLHFHQVRGRQTSHRSEALEVLRQGGEPGHEISRRLDDPLDVRWQQPLDPGTSPRVLRGSTMVSSRRHWSSIRARLASTSSGLQVLAGSRAMDPSGTPRSRSALSTPIARNGVIPDG